MMPFIFKPVRRDIIRGIESIEFACPYYCKETGTRPVQLERSLGSLVPEI